MSDIDVHLVAAAFALDALDDDEREAFELHDGECDVCRADVASFRDALAMVASAEAVPPPVSLKASVMEEVARTRQWSPVVTNLRDRRRGRTWMIAGGVAAAVALLAVGVAVLTRSTNDSYRTALAQVMEQPDARMIALGTKGTQSGEVKVAWSNRLHEAVMIGDGLSPAPAGKAYELWLITPTQSMAMYVLDRANGGVVRRSLAAPADPSAWAVTLEPSSGSAVATGSILFIAQV